MNSDDSLHSPISNAGLTDTCAMPTYLCWCRESDSHACSANSLISSVISPAPNDIVKRKICSGNRKKMLTSIFFHTCMCAGIHTHKHTNTHPHTCLKPYFTKCTTNGKKLGNWSVESNGIPVLSNCVLINSNRKMSVYTSRIPLWLSDWFKCVVYSVHLLGFAFIAWEEVVFQYQAILCDKCLLGESQCTIQTEASL